MFDQAEMAVPLFNMEGRQQPSKIKVYAAVTLSLFLGIMIGCAGAIAVVLRVGVNTLPSSSTIRSSSVLVAGPSPYEISPPPIAVPQEYLRATPLNNSCLIPGLEIPMDHLKPKTFDACGFVIKSTDAVWNLRGNVEEAIGKYFHDNYINAGSWGKRGIGKKDLHEHVLMQMRAFPDIKIHITDCICKGNDLDGYKCAMPDVLEGTNTGPSAYGPATGRYARWNGLVQSVVKKDVKTGEWQYWAEWGVHDEWALLQQLGLDITRVPHPTWDSEPLHDCTPLVRFSPQPASGSADAPDGADGGADQGAVPIYDYADAQAQRAGTDDLSKFK